MKRPKYNDPFPHTITIQRAPKTGTMEDQIDIYPWGEYTDTGGDTGNSDVEDPFEDDVYDPFADDGDGGNTGSSTATDKKPILVYSGKGYCGQKNTTNANGEVITSSRLICLPLTLDDWKKAEYKPTAGDTVGVDTGYSREWGLVFDFVANSLGSEVYFKFNHN